MCNSYKSYFLKVIDLKNQKKEWKVSSIEVEMESFIDEASAALFDFTGL